jgi:serine/threonine protein kinase
MTTETADWVGLTLDGRYAVTAKLGQGGMGFVYRAHDARLNCDVVVKVPRAAMLEDAGFRRRFQDEVRALVQLAHPHVVKVSDFGQHDGVPFAVMQFLPGGSLEDRRPKDDRGRFKPIAPRSLAGWLPQVADALDFIHKKGYVHRDVKPANILFDGSKNPYISDFGVAKAVAGNRTASPGVTGTGMVLGTPAYMAPELVMAEKFDGRIDQYALAVTVFELLAGRPPFDGATPMAVLVKRTTEDAPALTDHLPGTPVALSAAVARGLNKDPAARFPSCAAFAQAIVAATEASRGRQPPEAPRADAPGAPKISRDTPKATVTQPLLVDPLTAAKKRTKTGMIAALAGSGVLFAGVIGLTVWLAVRDKESPPGSPLPTPPSAPPMLKPGPNPPGWNKIVKPTERPKGAGPKLDGKPPPPPPKTMVTNLRASPATIKLLAGGPPQTLTVSVERTGDEPVTVAVRGFPAVQVTPAEPVTVKAGDADPTFQLTAPNPASKGTGTINVVATAGNIRTASVPMEVWRHDFDVSLAPHAPLELQAGQSTTVTVLIDRRGGYRGRLTLTLAGPSSLDARPVAVAADENEATFAIAVGPGTPAGTVTANLKASAAGIGLEHDVAFPVRIYSLAKVRQFKDDRPAGSVKALAIDPGGSLVLSGHADGTVRLWDAAAGAVKWQGKERHDGPVLSVAFSADGKHAVTGGADKLVFFWTIANGECKPFEKFHDGDVWQVRFDGRTPVSTSADKIVHWNPLTGKPQTTGQNPILGAAAMRLQIDPGRKVDAEARADSGGYELAGWGGDTLEVFQGASQVGRFPGNGGAIRAMSAAAGHALTLGGDGKLRLWDLRTKRLLPGFPLNPNAEVTTAALNPYGREFLLGGPDGALTLWRMQ